MIAAQDGTPKHVVERSMTGRAVASQGVQAHPTSPDLVLMKVKPLRD